MLYINIILLGICAILAIMNPGYIQNIVKYKNQEVLIVDWGIYAFTIVLIMIYQDIKVPLLFCYIASIIWNYRMYKNKLININPKTNFFIIVLIMNLIGIAEIIYYIKN